MLKFLCSDSLMRISWGRVGLSARTRGMAGWGSLRRYSAMMGLIGSSPAAAPRVWASWDRARRSMSATIIWVSSVAAG